MLETLNKKLHTPTWLFVLLVAVLILRIPSFFEPYSYGDEMIYLTLGEAIRQGIPLYKGIHDNKPPLLYIMAAIAGNLFWFKAILAFWSLITIYIFWKLTEVLLPKNSRAQAVATTIFGILTTIPLLEGNIVNAELFMIGPIILAFYLLLTNPNSLKSLTISGVLFAVGALFKIPAAFDIPVIAVCWVILQKKLDKNSLIKIGKRSLILGISFVGLIALTFVWYYFRGAFKEYLVAAFLQNFGYLSSWRPDDLQKSFLVKNGPLLMRAFIVLIASLTLYKFRKKLSKEFIFATLWLFFSLFGVTLSERPYPHYLIQSVGPTSLLFAMLFTRQNKEQTLTIIPLFFAFLVPVYFHFWYYPTSSYYQRFINLVSGRITKEQYLETFGSQVPRNYKIAGYLAAYTKTNEKVLVWGDGVPVYALSKRLPPLKYVADYHIKDFSNGIEVIQSIQKNMPNFIIVQPEEDIFPELKLFIEKNYGQIENLDGAQVWRIHNPQVRSLLYP